MKVFCTGATGFVGAHTALALLEEGHELRLLVRNEPAARSWFESGGHRIERFVTADIRDPDAVQRVMDGCDAVFHAAAAVSLDPRKARQTYDTNVGATQSVLAAASALGIESLLYVSSVAALFHPGAPHIDESTPLSEVSEAYSRSKRDSEEHVRKLQQQSMPVQITYPVAVVGPDDPKLSAANRGLATFIGRMLPRTTTGFQCVDVRDLARAHRWLLEHPPRVISKTRATSSGATSIRGTNCVSAWNRYLAGGSSAHASPRGSCAQWVPRWIGSSAWCHSRLRSPPSQWLSTPNGRWPTRVASWRNRVSASARAEKRSPTPSGGWSMRDTYHPTRPACWLVHQQIR